MYTVPLRSQARDFKRTSYIISFFPTFVNMIFLTYATKKT